MAVVSHVSACASTIVAVFMVIAGAVISTGVTFTKIYNNYELLLL